MANNVLTIADITKMIHLLCLFVETNIFNINTKYRKLRRINIHMHLPIVFHCRDVIKVCGQLWSQEQPCMKF